MDRTEYSSDTPVKLDRIVSVHFLHESFDGNVKAGQAHVLDEVAENVLDIFRQLFVIQFPIHSAIPVDQFDGNDVASMNANNSSAFNPRKIMDSDKWSSHAYGCAIDINPVQNPYVLNPATDDERTYPHGGDEYRDRENLRAGMVEEVVSIFRNHGFTDWGGEWEAPLDYHHFQLPWETIKAIT